MFLKVHCMHIVQFCKWLTHEACIYSLVTAMDIWSCVGLVSLYHTQDKGRAAALQGCAVPHLQRGTASTHLGFGPPCAEHQQAGSAGTCPRFPRETRSRGAVLSGQERQILLPTSICQAKSMPVTLSGRT